MNPNPQATWHSVKSWEGHIAIAVCGFRVPTALISEGAQKSLIPKSKNVCKKCDRSK